MNYLFIAFYGWPGSPIDQTKPVCHIDGDFEVWNLRKFSDEEFIGAIKDKIPPANKNLLKNYVIADKSSEGINKKQYSQCLWGILVPNPCEHWLGYKKALSILNLFSIKYMYPAFFVTNWGIRKVSEFKETGVRPNNNQGYEQFKTPNFVSFYKEMVEQMKYFVWDRNDALAWTEEDWRLFMASSFYDGLQKYETSKTFYTWQRESADMATLLETLFTAGDSQNEEIGYRLRKRVGSLIQWKFNDIERELKDLYTDRCQFVHGSCYKGIIKAMKKNKYDNAMPPPSDFEKLYKTKERIRFIFVAYLYLHKVIVSRSEKLFMTYKNVQEALEEAILNTELRTKIIEVVKPIVELPPES